MVRLHSGRGSRRSVFQGCGAGSTLHRMRINKWSLRGGPTVSNRGLLQPPAQTTIRSGPSRVRTQRAIADRGSRSSSTRNVHRDFRSIHTVDEGRRPHSRDLAPNARAPVLAPGNERMIPRRSGVKAKEDILTFGTRRIAKRTSESHDASCRNSIGNCSHDIKVVRARRAI
jgi:hypothetical protein